jgi:hypothetical protein
MQTSFGEINGDAALIGKGTVLLIPNKPILLA